MDMSSRYTIGELSERVGWVLSLTGADQQASGRIKAVPDIRTLRYYTTRGLLAPAEEMQGRTAYYGRRHLVQAVAIKRLQAAGESLGMIQQRIIGATDKQLEKWASIPDTVWDQLDQAIPDSPSKDHDQFQSEMMESPAAMEAIQPAFWKSTPTDVVPDAPGPSGTRGQLAVQWELAPGIRITWDDAQQAELAGQDPGWQRSLADLARHAARIRHHSGDELA
jgi:DNA-binding transcriptional MerR regulator